MRVILGMRAEPLDFARKAGLLALGAFALEELVGALTFVSTRHLPDLRGALLPVVTALTHWLLPLSIVYLVERRDLRALGFTVPRDRRLRYALYSLVGLVLPALILGADRTLPLEFLEQIVMIGLAEEVFFRGYLLQRWIAWLGDHRGLALGAIAFGVAHVVSRLSQHGLAYPIQDLMLGIQMTLGGLVMGLIYIRARNLIPGSILHISANLYLDKFIGLLGL